MDVEAVCFGKMFPSMLSVGRDREIKGQVFNYRVSTSVPAISREVGFDREAWKRCMACPEHDACYQVSLGVLLLEESVRQEERAMSSWVPR